MSKRSSRRKRQEKRKAAEARLTGEVLFKQGAEALKQANYQQSIKLWEKATTKKDAPAQLSIALAEGYFRQAVSLGENGLADFKKAVAKQPKDCIYRYHLALAYQRAEEFDQAEPIYRKLLAEDPTFYRASFALVQLLIAKKTPLVKDPVWKLLKEDDRIQLQVAEALVRRKADSTLRNLLEQPLDEVWQGLTAYVLGDAQTAQSALKMIIDKDQTKPLIKGVASYYLGLVVVLQEQLKKGLTYLQQAQKNGFVKKHLRLNMSHLTCCLALKTYQQKQLDQAEQLLKTIPLQPKTPFFHKFQQQLNWELGYQAAQKGDWLQALQYWAEIDEGKKPSRSLTFNLAIAHQKNENFREAADLWRVVLRRRPRKTDHPESLTDQQVARIWHYVAQNYGKAEDYEEAIKTYKTALKWAPDNLELRLQYVDALQGEGRWQAAENELNRILDKDPNNIRALILLGESYGDNGWGFFGNDCAREIWERILALEPQNPIAQQQLADWYIKQSRYAPLLGGVEGVIKTLQEGLTHLPNNQRLLMAITEFYIRDEQFAEARTYLAKALAVNPGDLQALHFSFIVWLSTDSETDIQQAFDRIVSLSILPPVSFYFDLYDWSFKEEQFDWTEKILVLIEEKYGDDVRVMADVARSYIQLGDEGKGIAILRKMIKEDADNAIAHTTLAPIYYKVGQKRLADKHWQIAQRLARRNNDQEVLDQIKIDKDYLIHGKRASGNPIEMFMNLPPDLKEQALKTAPPEIAAMLS